MYSNFTFILFSNIAHSTSHHIKTFSQQYLFTSSGKIRMESKCITLRIALSFLSCITILASGKWSEKKANTNSFPHSQKKGSFGSALFCVFLLQSPTFFPIFPPRSAFFPFLSLWKFILNPLEGVAALLCTIDK